MLKERGVHCLFPAPACGLEARQLLPAKPQEHRKVTSGLWAHLYTLCSTSSEIKYSQGHWIPMNCCIRGSHLLVTGKWRVFSMCNIAITALPCIAAAKGCHTNKAATCCVNTRKLKECLI